MSEKKETKNPIAINVDVGAKVSASLKAEIKTEIPKEVTGRVVSALLDVIRPFTEARGLRADVLRLQREDVLIEIAQKALRRADIENITLQPIPTKFLIPYMEKASTEDVDLDMHDRWAALLLSASKSYSARQLTFTDILSRLSSQELNILETVCFANLGFPETVYPNGHIENNHSSLVDNHKTLMMTALGSTSKVFGAFLDQTPLEYGAHIHASVLMPGGGTAYHYTEYGPMQEKFISLEILQRERLLDIRHLELAGGISIGYFEITKLGISFVVECSPDSAKMAARRPPPVQGRKLSSEEERALKEALAKSGKANK